jgi:3-dehydroquinate synthase/2-deoxy-scyllo-inosose synthase
MLLPTAPPPLSRIIQFGPYQYGYHVRPPAAENWAELTQLLADLGADRFALVTDDGVPAGTREGVLRCLTLAAPGEPIQVSVSADEKAKDIIAVSKVYGEVMSHGGTRRTVLVALGGGCVGNIAGLAAHLTLRGIRLVHIPTTLLHLSDAAVSLKQAVNSDDGKNKIGAFHAPVLVWGDLGFLESLPEDEIRCAMCEAAKNVLAILPDRYDWALEHLRPAGDYTVEELLAWIDLCVEAKSAVMGDDPEEKYGGIVLEYGHTVGHALELMTGGQIRHGYAIALGMLAEARVAVESGWLSAADMQAHRDLIAATGMPTLTIPASLATRDILGLVADDNKRGYLEPRDGFADIVQLTGLGKPVITEGRALVQVPVGTIAHAIDAELRRGWAS